MCWLELQYISRQHPPHQFLECIEGLFEAALILQRLIKISGLQFLVKFQESRLWLATRWDVETLTQMLGTCLGWPCPDMFSWKAVKNRDQVQPVVGLA